MLRTQYTGVQAKRAGILWVLAGVALLSTVSAEAGVVVRQRLDDTTFVALQNGQHIFLECRPPGGNAAEQFFAELLEDHRAWKNYRNLQSVAVPYSRLNGETQRRVIEALFPYDYCDEEGWWHVVSFAGANGQETWHAIAQWLTGESRDVATLIRHEHNAGKEVNLVEGQRLFIPLEELKPAFRVPSPNRPKQPAILEPLEPPLDLAAVGREEPEMRAVPAVEEQPAVTREPEAPEGEGENAGPIEFADADLSYGQDEHGEYASYKIRQGEAVYTSVVVRFTDFRTNEDIHSACESVLKRSGISDARRIDAGQSIRIPLDLLSDRYQPEGTAERATYEAVQQEATRLRNTQVASKDLDGVVVVLDPGHGGADRGAAHPDVGLYEDEINYDIACRLKKLLEEKTNARVYMTVIDPSEEYAVTNRTKFAFDKDEQLMTTPRYDNANAKYSANLRWYLSNDIYEKEIRRGTDPRKIVFMSIHCDALYYKMRGTMIYVPGAKYRRDREQPGGVIYARYEETNGHSAVTTTGSDRTRDEALSRNFAEVLIKNLRSHDPQLAVNRHGDPIRNVIRQGGGRAYVPAVLRNNLIPTKILVETANLNNATDRKRLADPEWRGWYASAMHRALLDYFDN